MFVGYNQEQGSKNWIFYDPYNWKVIEPCHTTFWENVRRNNKQVYPDWRYLKEDIIASFPLDLARREDGDKEHGREEGEGEAQEQEIPQLLPPEQNDTPAAPRDSVGRHNAAPPPPVAPQHDKDSERDSLAPRYGARERQPAGKDGQNPLRRARH